MVASPKVSNSKFSPVITIGRSPQMTKKIAPKLSGFGKLDDDVKPNILSKFGVPDKHSKIDTKIVDHDMEHEVEQITDLDLNSNNSNPSNKLINVNRKQRNIFKNIDSLESSHTTSVKNRDEDLPITDGIKASKKKGERETNKE